MNSISSAAKLDRASRHSGIKQPRSDSLVARLWPGTVPIGLAVHVRVTLCFVAALLCCLTVAGGAEQVRPPNIVFVLCDDLGYGDVQCLAPETSRIPTPNADRLAREGMTFTDAHSASSVCTPTRYGLLTGRYCWRTRLQKGVVTGFAPSLIDERRPTVAKFLQAQGYHTAVIGKWHLNFQYLQPVSHKPLKRKQHKLPPVGSVIPDGPVHRGFDFFHGFHHARDMEAVIENEEVIAHDKVENMLPRLADQAVLYLAQRSLETKPFFLYLPFGSPHTPIVPTEPWVGKSGLGRYGDFVMQTDAALGQVLEALDRYHLTDNTLLIFTSDNGCSKAAGIPELAALGHQVSAHLRGSKADIWEGGHRIPFLVRWPGKVTRGSTCSDLICLNDFFATTCELLHRPIPEGSCEDSISFLPSLAGQSTESKRQSLIHHSFSGHFAYREGSWKLILAKGSGGWTAPRERDVPNNSPEAQLYDLSRDPGETINVFTSESEVAEQLLRKLEQDVSAGRTTRGPASKNDVQDIVLWKSR